MQQQPLIFKERSLEREDTAEALTLPNVCGRTDSGTSGTRREKRAGPRGAPRAEFVLCKGCVHVCHHPSPPSATRHRREV